MSGEGILNGAGAGRRAIMQPIHDLDQPMVRIPGHLLQQLRPYAARRQISVMRMVRLLVQEVVAADLVDDVAGEAR